MRELGIDVEVRDFANLSGGNYKSKSKEESKRRKKGRRYSDRGYGRAFSEAALQANDVRLPLAAIVRLAGLSGTAITVAELLWWQVDTHAFGTPWPAVKLPIALFNACSFTAQDVSRALKQLEEEGLIQAHRKPGSRSTVTVLFHPVYELIDAPELEEEEL